MVSGWFSRLSHRIDNRRAFRAMLWLFAALLLVYGAIPVANDLLDESIKDYELWHQTGQKVLTDEEIYPAGNQKFPFMYPPAAALLLAPVSALGQTGSIIFLVLGNVVAWIGAIVFSVRLAAGTWARQPLIVYALPNMVISVYAWSNFHLGQPTLLLLMLVTGAFIALQTHRQIAAGALIALAAGIKAFPFIMIVYLVYRRYWIAAASMLASLAFLLLVLPAPFRGIEQTRTDLQRWTAGMLLKYDEAGMAQRPGRSQSWKNQSIFGVANRLLRHVDADDQYGPHEPVYANLADLPFQVVNGIIVAAALVAGLGYVAVLPRRDRRTRETDALEFALLILLLLIFTPLSFGYLFASLLFPFTVVVVRLLRGCTALLPWAAAGAVLLLALSIPLQRPAQLYGNTFFATLLLFVALAVELWNRKRRATGAETAPQQPPPAEIRPSAR